MISDRNVLAKFRMIKADKNEQPVGFLWESEGVRWPEKWSLNDLGRGGGGREVMIGLIRRCSGVEESVEITSATAVRLLSGRCVRRWDMVKGA